MIHRGFRYRLYPTPAQEAALWQIVGATRFVYNLALEQRRDWWRPGRKFSWPQQSKELSEARTHTDWLAAVPRAPLEQALRDLDRAYRSFFAGRTGYPKMRARGLNDAARFQARGCSVAASGERYGYARIPGVGAVRFRDTRPVQGRCLSVSITHKANAWFISFACEIEHEAARSILPGVGVDRGVANAVTLSTGELLSAPASLTTLARRASKARRILARRKRGSKRYARQQRRLARLTAKAASVRADFNHRASTDVARRFGHVGIEDLKTLSMTASGGARKRGLNRAILNIGWRQLERFLEYKLTERGGALIKVPAAYTSQTCAECTVVDARSRKSQSVFECVNCGHTAHADVNAALEILRRSTARMDVEGLRGGAPCEASTKKAAA